MAQILNVLWMILSMGTGYRTIGSSMYGTTALLAASTAPSQLSPDAQAALEGAIALITFLLTVLFKILANRREEEIKEALDIELARAK